MSGLLMLLGIALILWYVSKGLKWLASFLQALSLELEDRSHKVKRHNTSTRQQAINAVKPREVSNDIFNRRVKAEIEQMLGEVEKHPPK